MSTATQEATFLNSNEADCIVRLNDKGQVEVEWSCGDTYFFNPEFIQRVVDFLKPDTPEFAGVMLKALRHNRYAGGATDEEYTFSFAHLVDDGQNLWIDSYGESLNWPSFCDAWKEITTTK